MRKSGILMPVFSLPSSQATGTFGSGAYDFVRFLEKAGQKVWQILPLCPVDYTFSPYQSVSCFAGNTLFIDFKALAEDGLLSFEDLKNLTKSPDRCDYKAALEESEVLLKKAFLNFDTAKYESEYSAFLKSEEFWLKDFALYSAIKQANGLVSWDKFPAALKDREPLALAEFEKGHKVEIDYICFKQFLFFLQYRKLKDFAGKHGIKIFGDMPIYAAYDSADVWAHKSAFLLDKDNAPSFVAGTPPDGYSADGQVWGSPLYDFEAQRKEDIPYYWWKKRISHALKMYDIVRIDHFRAFEAFFAIPSATLSAKDGKWIKGPGAEFFTEIENALGKDLPIVAEDLGVITDSVKALLKATGFAGMRVLQFAFDGNSNNPYLPYNFKENCVGYISTHDNETLIEFEKKHKAESERFKAYIGKTTESFNWAAIRLLMASVANTVIFTMQDIMGQDEKYRFNTPGTTTGNWEYRIDSSCINDWLAEILKKLTKEYGR